MSLEIYSNIWQVINNPAAVRDRFAASLAAYGVNYSIPKTVAKYVDPYNGVAVGAQALNLINNVSYPENEHFLVLGLRGFAAVNATLGASAWVAGVTDALTIAGNFNITNNGSVELKNTPITVFQPGSNSPDAGFYTLEKPIFWKGQTQLSLTINWPVAPTTANQNIRIELWGIKLI